MNILSVTAMHIQLQARIPGSPKKERKKSTANDAETNTLKCLQEWKIINLKCSFYSLCPFSIDNALEHTKIHGGILHLSSKDVTVLAFQLLGQQAF